MRRACTILFATFLSLCSRAVAQTLGASPEDSLARAKQAFLNSDYDRAETMFRVLTKPGRSIGVQTGAEAFVYLAAIELSVNGRPAIAADLMSSAFRKYPDLDPLRYSADLDDRTIRLLQDTQAHLVATGVVQGGHLKLEGLPEGTLVTVDSQKASTDTIISPGHHRYRVEPPGYYVTGDTFSITSGQVLIRRVNLTPLPAVTLRVLSKPWSTVTINGTMRTQGPSAARRIAYAPAYKLRVERQGYLSQEMTLSVRPGTDTVVGPVELLPDPGVAPPVPGKLRSNASRQSPWLQLMLAAVDSADVLGATAILAAQQNAPRLEAAIAEVILAAGWSTALQQDSVLAHLKRALLHDPTVELNQSDFVIGLVVSLDSLRARLVGLKFSGMSPLDGVAGPDTFFIVTRTTKPAWLHATLADSLSGRVVWSDSILDDSVQRLRWNGRGNSAGPDQRLHNGRYILTLVAVGGDSSLPSVLRLGLLVSSAAQDTSTDPGPFPDSLLMPETRGSRGRAGLVVNGIVVGGFAAGILALGDANWLHPQAALDRRAVTIGVLAIGAGIVGALAQNPMAPDRDNMVRNARRRATWEQDRTALHEHNRQVLQMPYTIHLVITR